MRERRGSSLWPTARLSMLKPRRAKSPATRVSTPGLFSTSTDSVCFMASLPLARRRAADHLGDLLAGRHHREDVLLGGDLEVDHRRPAAGDRLAQGVGSTSSFSVTVHAHGAERLGEQLEVGLHLDAGERVALVPEQVLPLAHHAQVAVVEDARP